MTTAAQVDSSAPAVLGPVSATLETELRKRVQRHGVVVWLDLDEHYNGVVDALAAKRAADQLPYEVHAWRGSHLELMLALEDLTAGKDPPPLVVHLPGFNEETVRQTPLLELYLAGVRFRKGLDTLVTEAATGEVAPDELEAFVHSDGLTLEGADAWLRAAVEAREGGLAAQLRAISPSSLADDLLGGGHVAKSLKASANLELVWRHLEVALARPASWRADVLGRTDEGDGGRPKDVAHVMASWALAVEFVDDLRRAPIAPRLVGIDQRPAGIREACRGLAEDLRRRHPEFYRRAADETETLLQEEVEGAKAEDLGRVDTFRFEERAMLRAAIDALRGEQWRVAADYVS